MFWLFIPAIYFYIGPCMALVQNLAACPCAPFLRHRGYAGTSSPDRGAANRGILSDAYAGGMPRMPPHSEFGLLLLAPTGFWAA